jgi:predicted RND superfamily exporter protein
VADLGERLRSVVVERSRETIAVMLVVSLLVGSGAAAVDDSASLQQFETDSEAAEAQAYVDENFGTDANTTGSQIIVEGDDVLSKEGLLATLVLQERLRANETVNATLGADPFDDIAGIVAETAVRLDRGEDIRADAEELEARAESLNESREKLEARGEKLQARADRLNESRDELEARGEKLQERADRLNESREKLEARGEKLQARADRLNESRDELRADAEELKADAEQLRADAEELEEKARSFEIPPSEAEERREKLEQRREELEQRREKLNESRDELEERGRQLQENKSQLEADAAALQERADRLNESRAELEADAAALQERADRLNESRDELEADAEALEAKGETLEARAEELRERRNALAELELNLSERRSQLASMNESEIDDVLATILGESDGGSGAYVFLPTDYEAGSNSTDARTLFVTHETKAPDEVEGQVSEEVIEAQLAMRAIVEDTFEDGNGSSAGGPRESRGAPAGVAAAQSGTPTATPTPGGTGADGGSAGDDPTAAIDDGVVFGGGLVSEEINRSMVDSLLIVLPMALLFVAVVLTIAYRDVLDILLGLVGTLTVLLLTFGFMGWTGIAFNQVMISVPVLLIGLGIDYAIHVFMRHRERRQEAEEESSRVAMDVALGGVGVALLWVTATAVIGFLSNLTSPIGPLRDFGIVNAFGILAALVVFTVFVPALKVELDSFLEARGFDRRKRAFGTDGGAFESFLDGGRRLAAASPWGVVLVALLLTSGGVYGAVQLDTSFDQDDFIAEEPPAWMDELPEPFAPGEYTAKSSMALVNDRFVRQDTKGRILIEGSVTRDDVLERVADAEAAAAEKDTVQRLPDGSADIESPLSVMESVAARNATFNESFVAADTDGDGVPDRNVEALYDGLFATAPDRAAAVVHRTDEGDYEAVQLIVSARGDASSGAVAEEMRAVAGGVEGDGLEATATGQLVVFSDVEEELFTTVVQSLVVTILAVFLFLMAGYRRVHESASLGFVTLVPIVLSVTWILGTMYLLGIPFNVMTGTITSLTVGLGIAYNIHMSERYVLERKRGRDLQEAISRSVTGTGGALLGSAATTVGGFGVLAFSILPPLQQFGIITGLTIVYAFLGSVFLLPSMLVIWTRAVRPGSTDRTVSYLDDEPRGPATPTAGSGGGGPLDGQWIAVYERLGLSETEAAVFVALQWLDGASPDAIAAVTDLETPAVEAALGRLDDYGLLAPGADGDDRRRPLSHEAAVEWLSAPDGASQATLDQFHRARNGAPAGAAGRGDHADDD